MTSKSHVVIHKSSPDIRLLLPLNGYWQGGLKYDRVVGKNGFKMSNLIFYKRTKGCEHVGRPFGGIGEL